MNEADGQDPAVKSAKYVREIILTLSNWAAANQLETLSGLLGLAAAQCNHEWKLIEASGATELHSLTLREVEVLTWVARGKSAWEIGRILGITKRTVDEHARSAARKLGATNRTQASVQALLRHIIDVGLTEARR
jgi:DNA-binding CsgD family transcriptional regulator